MNQPPTEPGAPDDPVGNFTPGPKQKPASMARYKRELRKEIRRKAHEPEINFLNITAMLDMMTIILVFLLKTMSSSSSSMPQNDQLKLPVSSTATDPDEEATGYAVMVSKTELIVGDDTQTSTLAELPKDAAENGFDAALKPSGTRDQLLVIPLQQRASDWHQRDYKSRAAVDPGADPLSEARIIADGTISYRVLLEICYTLGQAGFDRLHLMVMQGSKQ